MDRADPLLEGDRPLEDIAGDVADGSGAGVILLAREGCHGDGRGYRQKEESPLHHVIITRLLRRALSCAAYGRDVERREQAGTPLHLEEPRRRRISASSWSIRSGKGNCVQPQRSGKFGWVTSSTRKDCDPRPMLNATESAE